MNIALALQHKLMQSVQRLMGATRKPPAPSAARSPGPANLHARPSGSSTPCFMPMAGHIAHPGQPVAAATMPLRVLRVIDKDQPRSCAGRLVISGRMADVCAELDRLVAREAALH